MRAIPLGVKGRQSLVVRPEHLASQFKDSILPSVFATPMLLWLMENAALDAVRPYLEAGESVVGTAAEIRHLAATPVGMRVSAEAEVVKVEGRRISFAVVARDEMELIGTGTHERAVIDLARFAERLAAKARA
jgi:fluoroacetyl-CoA thioesterase